MKSFSYIAGLCLVLALGAVRCKVEDPSGQELFVFDLPPGVEAPLIPEDNAMQQNRIALGRKLFYDPILSIDSTVSCGNCHFAHLGFANPLSVMPGVESRRGNRNTPTLTNVAYSPYFFAEGGSPTLEMQVLGPIENHDEMGFNAAELYERLKDHSEYQDLAQEAYGREMDLFVLTRAIAAFERTMVSGNSPFDRYFYRGDSSAMNEAQIRGWELFQSERTGCISCHSGFSFSSYDFANVGLYEEYEDEGLTRRTMATTDIGKFKIPTLRNVAMSAPYMHDGSISTLTRVVEHFNRGGVGHPNQSELVRPLGLNKEEIADLVAFLRALTDNNMVRDASLAEPQ